MIVLAALVLVTQIVDPGATGYTFLKLGIGVRPVAMGNAFTALSDDGNAIFWNPAGLGIVSSYSVSGMAMNHLLYFNYYNLTSAIPLGQKRGGFGVGISYLAASDVEYSERGEVGEEFRNTDMLINIGYGKAFGRQSIISFGGAVKIVRSQLYTYSAYGILGDVGVILNPLKYVYFGTVIKNIGTPRRFIERWEYPPINFRQGIALKIPFQENQAAVSLDYSVYPDVAPTFSVGGEVRIRSAQLMEFLGQGKISGFAVMAGYQSGYESGGWSGFSLGFSLELAIAEGLIFDIGALLLSYGYLGTSERIALGLNYVPTRARAKK
jgi:hypothetical protein